MAGGDMGREPLLEMFLFETNQMIEQLEDIIINCEKNQKLGPEAINEIFRIMHSIKGSSAMMMFNNISVVAHSLEDLFFFIRANSDAKINFARLSDLVLSGIDFTKNEIGKIENGLDPDGSPDQHVARTKDYLAEMKASCDGEDVLQEAPSPDQKKTMYYISNYPKTSALSGKTERKYRARVFFDEDCQMENVRAYTVMHNLKEISSEIYYIPADILDNNDSADYIKEQGFLLGFSTDEEHSEVEKILNQTAFLRKMEFDQVEEYPAEITALSQKREIILEDFPEGGQLSRQEAAEGAKEAGAGASPGRQQNIISVSVKKLDTLMDLVGEIVISEAMVTRNPGLEGVRLEQFNKAARQLRKLTNELQDIVMSIRMVPVSMTFHKMNRIVRDMSKKLNKDAELDIIGEATEVDKNIIDHLSDPLMHLIRNAMDHGLESKEERIKAGKPQKAKITLEARNAGGEVWIMVRDDGKGLDRQKILTKAREQGLVNKSENELTDKEVFSYILLPGFSTQEKVTEFSGRGVGMDVVKKNIEKIGGAISLESVAGKGTEVLIKIPLTLAIINGIEIGVGKARYMIPTISVKESFQAPDSSVIADADGNEIIMIRGQCYSVKRIHRLFHIPQAITAANEGIMVMIESNGKSACLFADQLLGEQQVVVKALPRYLKQVDGIAGCTILGDGSISLILDVNQILHQEL